MSKNLHLLIIDDLYEDYLTQQALANIMRTFIVN
jgi:hypothetical protein